MKVFSVKNDAGISVNVNAETVGGLRELETQGKCVAMFGVVEVVFSCSVDEMAAKIKEATGIDVLVNRLPKKPDLESENDEDVPI